MHVSKIDLKVNRIEKNNYALIRLEKEFLKEFRYAPNLSKSV